MSAIGKPDKIIVVEPVEEPVPVQEPEPAR